MVVDSGYWRTIIVSAVAKWFVGGPELLLWL